MIAKYPGPCTFCGERIKPGVDTYDVTIKKSYHEACKEAQGDETGGTGADAIRLAERLGFVPHNDGAIRTALAAWRVCDDWLLRDLLSSNRGDSTGRARASPPGGPDATLFDP